MTVGRAVTRGAGLTLVLIGVAGGTFTEVSIAWTAVSETSFAAELEYLLGYGVLAVVLTAVGWCLCRAASAQEAKARRARLVLGRALCAVSLPLIGLSVLSAVLSGLTGFADPESVRPAGFWLCVGAVLLWVGRGVLRTARHSADDDW